VIMISICFLLLCGVGGSIVYNSKEMIVLQLMSLVVVLMGWKYTKAFFHNVGGIGNNLIKIRYSTVAIFITGGSRFGRVEMVVVTVVIGGLMRVVNSWSRYVVNK